MWDYGLSLYSCIWICIWKRWENIVVTALDLCGCGRLFVHGRTVVTISCCLLVGFPASSRWCNIAYSLQYESKDNHGRRLGYSRGCCRIALHETSDCQIVGLEMCAILQMRTVVWHWFRKSWICTHNSPTLIWFLVYALDWREKRNFLCVLELKPLYGC